MDYFKRRARQILIEQTESSRYEDCEQKLYDGQPIQLKICYQQLKNIIKRPAVSYCATSTEKPHYMKGTFAISRSVVPEAKVPQLGSIMGQSGMNR